MGDQCFHQQVGEGAAGCDGVKALLDRRKAVPLNQHAGTQFILNHDLRHQSYCPETQGEDTQHCHVIDLRGYDGANPRLVQNQIKGRAHFALETGEQNRSLSQIFREAEPGLASDGATDQTNLLLGQ